MPASIASRPCALWLLVRRAVSCSLFRMSTATNTKKPSARKPAPKARAKKVPKWVGSGEGKAFVKPGVDLTEPTLPPGKWL